MAEKPHWKPVALAGKARAGDGIHTAPTVIAPKMPALEGDEWERRQAALWQEPEHRRVKPSEALKLRG